MRQPTIIKEILHVFNHLHQDLRLLLETLLIIVGGVILGLLLKYIIGKTLRIYNRQGRNAIINSVITRYNQPTRYFFPLLVVAILMPLVPLPPKPFEFVRRILEISLTISFSWMLIMTVYVLEDYIRSHYAITKADNIRERRVLTQLQFIKRMLVLVIIFFTVALVLMSFATVRKIGTGLITSAGIASVIIGFAAQRSIANLLAGMQLAFSQPIRVDDVLVLEGEWGRVEEITFTYVVIGIWDQRRLIVPLNYFIEKPFQNWTRSTAQLLGAVMIYTDYTLPVEEVRQALKRIVADHPLWDKRVCVLQVTDSKERTMELRALVSARNSSEAFDLRCIVREELIKFIQDKYPACLPKTRSELVGNNNFKIIPPDVAAAGSA